MNWLSRLDEVAWRRLSILHRDAATPADKALRVPVVVECEGRPYEEFFLDPQVKHIFVESKWAGGKFLESGQVTLLRPSLPLAKSRSKFSDTGNSRFKILAVGYGGMVKGFDLVFRVYERLKQEFPLEVIIAGTFGHNFEYYPEITRESYDRADFPHIEHSLRADPNATFRIYSREELMSEIYPAADVYLHLSRLETFGYSILEAMSFGLPVIATDIHAIPEMVKDGETGFLIDAEGADINSEEWRERVTDKVIAAVRKLLLDPALRDSMSRAALSRVEKSFDIEFKRREVARVYKRIIASA